MPLHRNECLSCGHRFRVLELPGDASDAACPVCGGRDARRLLPHVAVQFKGNGFYRTDYARHGGNASPPAADT
jgi:putative FmdB family regulatory protein